MPKLDGFQLEVGKFYAVGVGTKKKPVKTVYNVNLDQWYIHYGDGQWDRMDDFIAANPGIEIDEIDDQGNQVGSDTDGSPVGEAVDVMPALAAAAPVTSDATPAWME